MWILSKLYRDVLPISISKEFDLTVTNFQNKSWSTYFKECLDPFESLQCVLHMSISASEADLYVIFVKFQTLTVKITLLVWLH